MAAEPFRLDTLVESVADGTSVDWEAAEAAADEGQRRVIRHLRLVAGIADVHRTLPGEATRPSPSPPLFQQPPPDGAVPRWGHLLLMQTVGEGAFGEVYRARDPWLDREVALKLLKPAAAGPGRLLAEAQALARVRHPNVVTVHGADLHDGRVGLWMEFVRGRTLSEIVTMDGPLSGAEATLVGEELCRALAAVHAAGLIHRDIKAQNVMRESGGRLVLMDFGAGHTPLYLAPELLDGGDATAASDIYALGVLLFYLVTGRYPVSGSSIPELKQAHTRGDRRRLAEARPDLPEHFVAAVERALHPDPAQRYQTAWDMRMGLVPSRPRWLRPSWIAAAAVAALTTAAAGGYLVSRTRPAASSATTDIRMVALLPLRPDSRETTYFADGMTEALMQELAGIRALRVVSRTSVDRARQTEATLPAIARALNADAVLEGSVNKTADDVRVNLRLIHAGSDSPVWARSFEQPLRHVFALQRDVARAVAGELSVAIGPVAGQQIGQVDPAANDLYLRGRYFLHQESVDGMKQAIGLFGQAARADPKHARAHAGIAQAYLALGAWYNAMPRAEAFRLSRDAVTRALAIDDALADAHGVLAEILFEHDWDWAGAEREFLRALELNPSLEYARERYAMFLAARGRTDAALTQIADARRVDPLSPLIASSAGGILRYARRYTEAIDQYTRVLATHPELLSANVGLARTLNASGRHEEAIAKYRDLARRGFNEAIFALEIAQADAAAGRVDQARRAVEALRKESQRTGANVPPEYLAYAYGRIGDLDEAFRWLDQAFRLKSGLVLWLPVDYRADPMRSDPRFQRYLDGLSISR